MIIGLIGKPQSGKDTIAKHLVKRHGFVKYAFADPIRAMLHIGLGIDPELITDKDAITEPYGKSFRYMQQTLGTEWMRNIINSEGWVMAAQYWLKGQSPGSNVVFSDVRFANEFNFIKSEGGVFIRVRRLNEQTYDHESEAWQPDPRAIDYELSNNQSIRHMTQEVDVIVIQNEPLVPPYVDKLEA